MFQKTARNMVILAFSFLLSFQTALADDKDRRGRNNPPPPTTNINNRNNNDQTTIVDIGIDNRDTVKINNRDTVRVGNIENDVNIRGGNTRSNANANANVTLGDGAVRSNANAGNVRNDNRFEPEFNPEFSPRNEVNVQGGQGGRGGNATIEEGAVRQQQELNVGDGALSPTATATIESGAVTNNNNPVANATIEAGAVEQSQEQQQEQQQSQEQSQVAEAYNAGNNQNINIEYGVLPAPAGVATPLIDNPELFTPFAPAAEVGIDLFAKYQKICQPRSTARSPNRPISEDVGGRKDRVNVSLLTHQNYREGSVGRGETGIVFGTPPEGIPVSCAGLLTVEADDGKDNVAFGTVYANAEEFLFEHLDGYGTVYVVTRDIDISANRGVQGSGIGANVLPGGSFASSMGDAVRTLGMGLAGSRSQTVANVKTGFNAIVVYEDRSQNGSLFPRDELWPPKPEPVEIEESQPVQSPVIIEDDEPVPQEIIRQAPSFQPEYRQPQLESE